MIRETEPLISLGRGQKALGECITFRLICSTPLIVTSVQRWQLTSCIRVVYAFNSSDSTRRQVDSIASPLLGLIDMLLGQRLSAVWSVTGDDMQVFSAGPLRHLCITPCWPAGTPLIALRR